jgi:hypothetical protein
MLFNIIATVYILIAGQPIVDEPARVQHKATFKNIEECQAYMTSQSFELQRQALAEAFRRYTAAKIKANLPEEEEVPDISVAVTATCEEDRSI